MFEKQFSDEEFVIIQKKKKETRAIRYNVFRIWPKHFKILSLHVVEQK